LTDAELDIAAFHGRLRGTGASAEALTASLLARIAALEPAVGAFEHVDHAGIRTTSHALDALLAAGTDLGPLMGTAVAVKDLLAVWGMPTTAGCNVDVSDIIGDEGPFIGTLRRAGCVVLGKVKTVEFAFGGSGLSTARGTPWNPQDLTTHRAPGGSSSGSAAAVAAGMASFAIGSDTGGSVRVPASFCGVVGWKTSKGLFPTSGVFPLSRDLDTLGFLCRSAADAAFVYGGMTGRPIPIPRPLRGLRVGLAGTFFTDRLEPAVATAFETACRDLAKSGVVFSDIALPGAHELDILFAGRNAADLIATFGEARFRTIRDRLGPAIAARMESGLTLPAHRYLAMQQLQNRLAADVVATIKDIDCWIAPTTPMTAPAVVDFDLEDRLETDVSRFTRQANYYRLCALSLPVPQDGLPVGLQIVCPLGRDDDLLRIGQSIETLLGRTPLPDLSALASRR
jgi:aspartyl-tRNA(Asn)/glutamyl-tRNA(Gln) amidotransferase subunit A